MTIKMPQPRPQQFSKKLKQDIQQQLRQTMTTLRLLPLNARDRPNMPKSSWGEFKQITMLSSPQYRTPIRRKATPQEISKMDFWLIALGDLPEHELLSLWLIPPSLIRKTAFRGGLFFG